MKAKTTKTNMKESSVWRRGLILLLGTGLVAVSGPTAQARSSSLLSYPIADLWPTAVRFLRIDRGAAIKEKDAESGYVLFDLPEGGKSFKGSLELIRTIDGEGREATKVVVTVPDLPRHYEGVLLDKLASKARDEYGSPAPPPPRRTPSEGTRRQPPDAGRPFQDLPRIPGGELPRPERR
jgi:hypothetical protein